MTEVQILWALVVVIAYGIFCWLCLHRGHRQPLPQASHCELLIGFASQSGEAESIARKHAKLFTSQGPVEVLPLDQITPELLSQVPVALFIVSTYGEGEPPDNALRFAKHWNSIAPNKTQLENLRFAVLALGDSNYRFFCGFGKTIADNLQTYGAKVIFEPISVDRLCREHLQHWQDQLSTFGIAETSQQLFENVAPYPEFEFTLNARQLLNPGSLGGPIYQTQFKPAAGQNAHWQAGDIAVFALPGNKGLTREYSIASIPEDGYLELVVRQLRKDDGTLGEGSGFLSEKLTLKNSLRIKIRNNTGFHPPASDQPMILIGNGTGIAGLKSHLRYREQHGGSASWLIFGERSLEFDRLFDNELKHWLDTDVLSRLDRIYSRDNNPLRYVQDLLAEQHENLRTWIENGAAIYVCGSQQSMAPAVHRVLVDTLGEPVMEALILTGRYRRDIY